MESPNQRTKSFFLSDAHLGARYIADPRQHERRVVDIERMMAADAKAVYLLGDMIDFWFEYRYVIPKGFTRFLGQLAAMTDAGIRVYWFKGNHDMWTTDYLERELGVTVVGSRMIADIDGKRFYMSHGDGEGPLPAPYRILRKIFHNATCRRIGASLHPRWLMGFGLRWSAHNRLARADSNHGSRNGAYGNLASSEPQTIFTRQYSAEHPEIDHFVFGHLHYALQQKLDNSHATYTCLGECFSMFTYAVFDGEKLELKQFATGSD